MVVEGINVEDIFDILTCLLTFRILAHEEDQYSYVYKILNQFLSIALKQPEAGPRSSGIPVLVSFISVYSRSSRCKDYTQIITVAWL